jgi:ABC-type hemin transport system ATPase subunit
MKWIYQMNRVRVSRGDKLILDDVTLAFLPGAKIGLVGPNGAGKSTVLKIMAGWSNRPTGRPLSRPTSVSDSRRRSHRWMRARLSWQRGAGGGGDQGDAGPLHRSDPAASRGLLR